MTKLTDIQGASEAFKDNESLTVYNYKSRELKYYPVDSVHLEVDVEAMVKLTNELASDYDNSLIVARQSELINLLSTTIPKWANLVRK